MRERKESRLRFLLSFSVSSQITAFRPSQPAFWVYSIQHHPISTGPLFQKHYVCQQMFNGNSWNAGVWYFGAPWIVDPQNFNLKNGKKWIFQFLWKYLCFLVKDDTHNSVLCPQVRVKWVDKASELYLWSDYWIAK